MSLVCILLCSSGLAPVAVAAGATLDDTTPAAPARRVRLDVTATVNGSPAGEIAVETDSTGSASVDFAQLLVILGPVASPAILDGLRARSAGSNLVSLTDLSDSGISIGFDMATLRLNIVVPLDARAVNQLAIVDQSRLQGAGRTAPEAFSTGITFFVGQRFRHVSDFGDIDREPLSILAEGFVNLGGVDGVNLAFQGGYREGGKLARRRTTLFHDDVRNAIRYSAGDVDPQLLGSYAASTSIAGIGIERLYTTIQPYRNLRPAGRGSLIIERPSRVDVLVNGSIYRTLDLVPGQYDIRDFPALNGLNDVQLVVRDDSGNVETTSLSFFSDVDLLDADVSIFSAAIGFRRNRFGEFVSTAYEESPIFSGFYLRGVTDRLTLGGSVQIDKDNQLVSGQAVVATPVGVLGFEAALDFNRRDSTESAFTLSYRANWGQADSRSSALNVDLQYRSAHFSPMEKAGVQPNRFSWEVSGRYQTPIDTHTYISATAGYGWSRSTVGPDTWTTGLSATRRFGRINTSFAYSYRRDDRGSDHRGLFSINIPLGPRQSARASYDTRDNRVSADYQLVGFEALGQTDLRAGLSRSDSGRSANVEVEHYSNRVRLAARHSYDRFDGTTDQVTDVSARFGIGFAGGKLALGRDAGRGFVIVDTHRTLNKSDVVVSDSFSLGAAAKSGALGPALVPVRRAYQPTTLTVDVENLPNGYDIGPGRYDILPGAASGYAITVGSAAANTVLGRIVDAEGQPLTYVSGTLEPISGEDAQSVQFFTNRTGRMAVLKVAPGRYRVMLSGQSTPIGEVVVPSDATGMVDIGELREGGSR